MAAPQAQANAELSSRLLQYTNAVNSLGILRRCSTPSMRSPSGTCKIRPLGALLLPLRWGDLSGFELGKTVFLHGSAPKGWWEEQRDMMRQSPGPGEMLARLALAPFTMSETMSSLDPLGVDRWPFELALKYGMRDRLSCPIGGRWLVVYWSRYVLSNLSQEQRALLFLGATFAAIRLQRLAAPSTKRLGKSSSLTPRELAVLRLLASGKRMREIAQLLGLGEESVRSHLKKAQVKLGVSERTHASPRPSGSN